jgi:hypothetical protein
MKVDVLLGLQWGDEGSVDRFYNWINEKREEKYLNFSNNSVYLYYERW